MVKNGKNSGPLTSLPVDHLTATDCNSDRSCQLRFRIGFTHAVLCSVFVFPNVQQRHLQFQPDSVLNYQPLQQLSILEIIMNILYYNNYQY